MVFTNYTSRSIDSGATVTFLVRNLSSFDNDETIQPYIASGKARLVKGDALKEEDVRNAWRAAAEGEGTETVDLSSQNPAMLATLSSAYDAWKARVGVRTWNDSTGYQT